MEMTPENITAKIKEMRDRVRDLKCNQINDHNISTLVDVFDEALTLLFEVGDATIKEDH